MPTVTRWFIKTGMLYFAVGMLMGALLLAQPVLDLPAALQSLRPVYLHYIFIGWVTQLIMGIGYWMFPRASRENPRGREWLAWTVYALLNVGMIFRTIGEPLLMMNPRSNAGWTLGLASTLLLLAGWGYVLLTWGRIKER